MVDLSKDTFQNQIENELRSFSMYVILKKPLVEFLTDGDGINALPVYDENSYEHVDVELIDCSLINFVKFISTAFGRCRLQEAFRIMEKIKKDGVRKETLRFRSRHPLFVDGSPRYQNVCLISGMIFLGIPIFPYFDGLKILETDEQPDNFLKLLESEHTGVFDVDYLTLD